MYPAVEIVPYKRNMSAGFFNSEHDQTVEYEAYSSGAAALVPYKPLKTLLLKTQSLSVIGQRFRVSPALVRYRANVTRLAKHIR